MAVAVSAGTAPGQELLPTVVEALREIGIDARSQRPKALTEAMAREANRVIAMGCNVQEACPALQMPIADWGIEDPSQKPIEGVRRIRDEIRQKVEELLAELGVLEPSPERT
jgi:arsenate reductase